jgi:hypothetical protein
VENITGIHQLSRFPLVGPHVTADCYDCHPSESLLRFEPLGVECYDCHQDDYLATTSPNHTEANYSTECGDCHFITSFTWTGANVDHSFFPLTAGHDIGDCFQCHVEGGDYSNISSECVYCHQTDYDQTSEPNHADVQFPPDNCEECHTTNPGWKPADFDEHDALFPIYSGKHNGEWNTCADCHTTTGNYGLFSCIDCHEHNQGDTDGEHDEVGGYVYDNMACFECHPTGDADEGFDHNASNFPLTGAHIATECSECHINGFSGTPTQCFACHEDDFVQTTNPNHNTEGIANDCETCHTTEPDWKPALFPDHNETFPLLGAHATVPNCFDCHEGNYVNTPNFCFSCHSDDYNQTTNPPHESSQFSTECETCHDETAWTPSTFDHDGQYFPIYSGEHQGEWTECAECHTTPSNFGLFSCIDCHDHNQADTDEEHNGIGGYTYNSSACYECHPTGEGAGGFNHNNSNFPLTGAHLNADCLDCHANGYAGTPTLCFACHEGDFNLSVNPNHNAVGIPNDCESCHTTNPGWQPASFPIHNVYYPLTGAHLTIAGNCFICHEGNYNSTPNTCAGCHLDDYNQTTDPNHVAAQFPTDCEACHTTNAWTPATFEHDGQFFPIYSGEHQGEWNSCSDCHTNPGNYAIFTCLTCHEQGETDDEHDGVGGYSYNSLACFECHPTGSAEGSFNHNSSNFPLTGAHLNADCLDCHANGYAGTPTFCFACHEGDFNLSVNPNHNAIGIPNDCESCHTTNPGWQPATFAIHDNYYPLTGEHTTVANDCFICHEGDYNNTPNECIGCHMDDYNQSANPDHDAISIPTDCEVCHTTSPDWQPATFPIHNEYWPLTGAHLTIASDCYTCHQGNYNNTPNECAGCHMDDYNGTTDPNHAAAQFPTDCELCHTTIAWVPSTFDHDGLYFPIYSGEHEGEWNSCSECHPNPSNYSLFTCLTCHEQGETDDEHDEVPGYSYNSDACYACHPNGEAEKKMYNRY